MASAEGGGPLITDWISAGGTGLTFLVALAALIYARGQVNEAKSAREQARELELERSQPYVVVYTEPSAATNMITDIVIKNYGATAAHDVRVALSPWPKRSLGRGEDETVGLPSVIPVLAPGQEWRTMWDSGVTRADSELPDRHEGHVTFRGLEGKTRTSPIVLDLGIYEPRMWATVYGVHDVAEAVRGLKTTIGRWSEGWNGINVVVRDGDARDEASRAARQQRYGTPPAEPAVLVGRTGEQQATEAPIQAREDDATSRPVED